MTHTFLCLPHGRCCGWQARLELLNLIGHAYASVRSRFDYDDTRQTFGWIEKFCKNPWSDDDAANTAQVAMGMPPVQKVALTLLPTLAPTHAPKVGGRSQAERT